MFSATCPTCNLLDAALADCHARLKQARAENAPLRLQANLRAAEDEDVHEELVQLQLALRKIVSGHATAMAKRGT